LKLQQPIKGSAWYVRALAIIAWCFGAHTVGEYMGYVLSKKESDTMNSYADYVQKTVKDRRFFWRRYMPLCGALVTGCWAVVIGMYWWLLDPETFFVAFVCSFVVVPCMFGWLAMRWWPTQMSASDWARQTQRAHEEREWFEAAFAGGVDRERLTTLLERRA
jgi:hypothetical protein